jgi:NAD(P)-dependent dehydrogenase (short-subunit alcohol dehydrogenase family)
VPSSAPVEIVTGSNSGIRRPVAEALARDGFDIGITFPCDVAGADRTAATVLSLGRRAQVRQLDPTALPAAEVIDELAAALGGVDVLVNNTGVIAPAPFLHLDFDTGRRVLSVDLDGPFLYSQRAAAAGSSISPACTSTPRVGAATYCAARPASVCSPAPWPSSWRNTASPSTRSPPARSAPR